DEVNADPVHRRAKLREPVDRLLLPAPVERSGPVFDEAAQLGMICSECPSIRDLIRPTRSLQAIVKVVQCALRYVDYELVDAHHFGSRSGITSKSGANCVPESVAIAVSISP